ncbi:L-cystine transporter [Jeotgalibaca ciconiae]|uniref:L-cystine uptake protein TcyP n=1 Tax=Jeotgalibaca ciconiae TaxID=2496265 RepID=A0A3Q9BJ04_9LACT|nr:cation:dicarboxylase symporter family transporter [Jeotgalibaca ciconiae]AZP03469.1 cation:dicarboxylase symporter family transporter [Jeotgalibaca ciconiae]HJB23258.1 cation:dicarboxylase symporter family transporter [Candidatus Jeotgalibaca pullicola]
MNTVIIIGILVIFVAFLFLLHRMASKYVKFSTRVFTALAIGLVFGIVIQLLFEADSEITTVTMDWMNIVGSGYVRFLQMLIMPLIFVSVVGAFTKIEQTKDLGKISFSVLITLLGTTAIAAFIGWAAVMIFNLDGAQFVEGAAEAARIEALAERQQQVMDLTIPGQILNFIPSNVFEDFAGLRSTSTISVVIFSSFVGVAYMGIKRKDVENAVTFKKGLDAIQSIIMRIVTLVLRLTPFGILALTTRMTATSSFQAILNLGIFVLASYAALFVVLIVHSLILLTQKVSPIAYFKKAFPVLSFAFTARSSAGALPLNIKTQTEALGVDSASANFSASFGVSIGQNGCAGVYPAMLATIIAPSVGIDVTSVGFILSLIAIVTIGSFGVAGVGGGATFAALIVLGALNLPIAIVGLVISVEPVIDMMRTMVNVNDSMLAGVVSSRVIGQFDDSIISNPEAVVENEGM